MGCQGCTSSTVSVAYSRTECDHSPCKCSIRYPTAACSPRLRPERHGSNCNELFPKLPKPFHSSVSLRRRSLQTDIYILDTHACMHACVFDCFCTFIFQAFQAHDGSAAACAPTGSEWTYSQSRGQSAGNLLGSSLGTGRTHPGACALERARQARAVARPEQSRGDLYGRYRNQCAAFDHSGRMVVSAGFQAKDHWRP